MIKGSFISPFETLEPGDSALSGNYTMLIAVEAVVFDGGMEGDEVPKEDEILEKEYGLTGKFTKVTAPKFGVLVAARLPWRLTGHSMTVIGTQALTSGTIDPVDSGGDGGAEEDTTEQVYDIEVYDQDPDGAHNPQPIATFDPDGINGSLDLSIEETIKLYIRVDADDGLATTASTTSSNSTKMPITTIDGNTVTIEAVEAEIVSGNKVTFTATSDADSTFNAGIEVTLHKDQLVANTESTIFELETA